MANIYLDIETIGTDDPDVRAEIAATILPPGNISKAETIAAWELDKKPALIEEAVKKTSFDGGLGHVIVIGYATDNSEPRTCYGPHDLEAELLREVALLNFGHSSNIVGHNVGWDIRFLWQRFVVCGVQPPAWLKQAVRAKPWDTADTMTMWNPERERKTSLEKLCRVLRVPTSKGDLDGSKVWDAYKAGKLAEIAEYCRGDVRAMRDCYLRMTA